MDSNTYQHQAARTETDYVACLLRLTDLPEEERMKIFRLNHALTGLTGEVGELASQWQKFMYYQRNLDETNMVEEVGDVLWYVALLLNTLGISIYDVMEANIAKLRKRFPDKFCFEAAKEEKRDLVEERKAVEGFLEYEMGQHKTLAFASNSDPETQDMPYYCCSQRAEGLPCQCPVNRAVCGATSGV